MDGRTVEEGGEASGGTGEEVIGRDVEFGRNRESFRAEEIHNEGVNDVTFGDGKQSLAEIGVVEAKKFEHEGFVVRSGGEKGGRKRNGREVVEDDGRINGGRDGGYVARSGNGIVGWGDGEDVNGKRLTTVVSEYELG